MAEKRGGGGKKERRVDGGRNERRRDGEKGKSKEGPKWDRKREGASGRLQGERAGSALGQDQEKAYREANGGPDEARRFTWKGKKGGRGGGQQERQRTYDV